MGKYYFIDDRNAGNIDEGTYTLRIRYQIRENRDNSSGGWTFRARLETFSEAAREPVPSQKRYRARRHGTRDIAFTWLIISSCTIQPGTERHIHDTRGLLFTSSRL